ncbi:unnamed protein product [Microthlaspi erraticum]|uniref:Integrase zinc-binding domain-containing protein n=1 Tax=Microthlaspi erraticum TaxID=1685480 RepID=A0A6D2JWF0_9BRAS|nr:unnamed protein product [Microthlaspi erraticum]
MYITPPRGTRGRIPSVARRDQKLPHQCYTTRRTMGSPPPATKGRLLLSTAVLVETHKGASGNHAGGRSLTLMIKKIGFFWPKMIEDCENLVAKSVPCQRYSPIINAPTQAIQASIPAYPFMRWGMDIVGPMLRSR